MKIIITNIKNHKLEELKDDISYLIPSINKEQLEYTFENIKNYQKIIIDNYKIESLNYYFDFNDDIFNVKELSHISFSYAIRFLKKYKNNSNILEICSKSECDIINEYLSKRNLNIIDYNKNDNKYFNERIFIFNKDNIEQISFDSFKILKERINIISFKEFKRIIKLKQLL